MIHPAIRRLISRRGPVCFGDFSSGQPTPKPFDDLTVDRTVRAVLDFVNRFAPRDRQFKTMEQVAADPSLFGKTLDEEFRLIDLAKGSRESPNSFERRKSEAEAFQEQRSWVASAIVTFRRYGYEGLADPNLIPDSERHKSQY
jgi:hypothetical protein